LTEARTNRINEVLDKRQNNFTIILENIGDPHNISAVMRSADAIGLKEIYVCNTIIEAHEEWGPKSSSSASKWLMVHQFTNTKECIEAVRKKYDKIYTTHLSESSKSLYELNLTENVALVFGNERIGITQEMLQAADANFLIPQVGMIQSLNISVACAICLYEGLRQKQIVGHYEARNLNEIEIAELAEYWDRKDWKEY
jgi:tRNA (guanosine-2'-O-)-methyltransferase